jgi:hypothetical protein
LFHKLVLTDSASKRIPLHQLNLLLQLLHAFLVLYLLAHLLVSALDVTVALITQRPIALELLKPRHFELDLLSLTIHPSLPVLWLSDMLLVPVKLPLHILIEQGELSFVVSLTLNLLLSVLIHHGLVLELETLLNQLVQLSHLSPIHYILLELLAILHPLLLLLLLQSHLIHLSLLGNLLSCLLILQPQEPLLMGVLLNLLHVELVQPLLESSLLVPHNCLQRLLLLHPLLHQSGVRIAVHLL